MVKMMKLAELRCESRQPRRACLLIPTSSASYLPESASGRYLPGADPVPGEGTAPGCGEGLDGKRRRRVDVPEDFLKEGSPGRLWEEGRTPGRGRPRRNCASLRILFPPKPSGNGL